MSNHHVVPNSRIGLYQCSLKIQDYIHECLQCRQKTILENAFLYRQAIIHRFDNSEVAGVRLEWGASV